MNDTTKPDGLELLRVPFADNQIAYLPKETKPQIEERKAGKNAISCRICHNYHHKNAVHLDYVGHASVTNRLLEADLKWTWEPVAFGDDGLPKFDNLGGLWIRLTVCGVTRLGYGNADPKGAWADVGAREKEVIGDALRNSAMRFGVALDLWSKADLNPPKVADGGADDGPPIDGHPIDVPERQDSPPPPPPPASRGGDPPSYPKKDFDDGFPKWKEAIEKGSKTANDVIAMLSAKGTLNPVQKAKINSVRRAA